MSATTAHHDEHRDDIASKLGMWLFIFTELLLFGGLFVTYSVYRYQTSRGISPGSSGTGCNHGDHQYGDPADQQYDHCHVHNSHSEKGQKDHPDPDWDYHGAGPGLPGE